MLEGPLTPNMPQLHRAECEPFFHGGSSFRVRVFADPPAAMPAKRR
jgi:hypothetical protein